ncbi:MAG: coproporphyrinogen III oxidase family protein [Candidatus Riflebacteria bacterium]|nr:coproporphyrinogen III oxidase family protein [Candidatus Riflebacteria bacterium]
MIDKIISVIARREFGRALNFDDNLNMQLPQSPDNNPRLLYLHIPFCEELCPYCSFHRILFSEKLCRDYFEALFREILLYKEKGYNFGAIYVGGGTPTILIDELARLIVFAKELFPVRQISVETNPNHLTPENLTILREAGVNRLSCGVQTFQDKLLKKICRLDKYGSGIEIAHKLRNTKNVFETLNVDLIFNFPGQTMEMVADDLAILKKLQMDQITFYPLMVSDFSRKEMTTNLGEFSSVMEKRMYKFISHSLHTEYETSSAWCFSRKSNNSAMLDEYVVDYDEYAGLGSGSIGYLNGVCYANTFDIAEYIRLLNDGRLPRMASRIFSHNDRMRYDFMMKLFSTRMNLKIMQDKYDGKFSNVLWKEIIALKLAGALRYFHPDLYLTKRGRYYWVIIMREFFTAVNNFRDHCRKSSEK